ncbi:MAG: endonuclease III [Actinomycetota bacterium]|nr:endonuclease III [Actinomycetota bacterium]
MLRRLRKSHGPFVAKPRLPILDELILTVLSQATSDTNRDRAFAGLTARFGSWDDVASAPTTDVADAIRSGGIADVKAARIRSILGAIEEREGSLDLSRLESLPDDEVTEYLCSLPGVGPKTAACVLVFSMGRSAFPIDTHVYRVSRRLGWIDATTSAAGAHKSLSPAVPSDIRYELHVAMIRHGREVCVPRRPFCSRCVVLDLCDAGPGFIAAGEAR